MAARAVGRHFGNGPGDRRSPHRRHLDDRRRSLSGDPREARLPRILPLAAIVSDRFCRPGWAGAARLGFAHGLYCLGCCALLMTLLFVFGVMNLVWVAALALFVMVEKLLPVGPRFSTGVGIAAAIVGLGMIIGVRLPGAP